MTALARSVALLAFRRAYLPASRLNSLSSVHSLTHSRRAFLPARLSSASLSRSLTTRASVDMAPAKEMSKNKMFGGFNKKFSHDSACLSCEMKFSVFLPPGATEGAKVPVRVQRNQGFNLQTYQYKRVRVMQADGSFCEPKRMYH
jgi:hypothetical protein